MSQSDPLDAIARLRDWPEQAERLAEAADRPEQYGLSSASAVLRAVARGAGCEPSILRQRTTAWRFVANHYPDRLSALSDKTSMRAILVLSRGQAFAPEVVSSLLDETIAGRHSVRHLEQRLAPLRATRDSHASPAERDRRQTRETALAFEATVGALLSAHPELICSEAGAEVHAAGRKRDIPADFVVELGGRVIAVVEVKAPQIGFHTRQIVEVLGVLALHAAQGLVAWLVMPASWAQGLDRIVVHGRGLTLPREIRFATVDEEQSGPAAFREVAR